MRAARPDWAKRTSAIFALLAAGFGAAAESVAGGGEATTRGASTAFVRASSGTTTATPPLTRLISYAGSVPSASSTTRVFPASRPKRTWAKPWAPGAAERGAFVTPWRSTASRAGSRSSMISIFATSPSVAIRMPSVVTRTPVRARACFRTAFSSTRRATTLSAGACGAEAGGSAGAVTTTAGSDFTSTFGGGSTCAGASTLASALGGSFTTVASSAFASAFGATCCSGLAAAGATATAGAGVASSTGALASPTTRTTTASPRGWTSYRRGPSRAMITLPTWLFASLYWAVETATTPPFPTSTGEATAETSAPERSTTRRGGSWSLKTV